ncbi:MAG: hypothetical protein QM778_38215 [Myxococcales bacterium]
MRPSSRFALALSFWAAQAWWFPSVLAAQPPRRKHSVAEAPPRADHEQEGERALSEGRHADAARAFMAADDDQRSMAVLGRAFEAANLSSEPLLLVQVSERILSRPEVSDDGRTLARRAVAKASDHLTQLELVCGDRACEFEVDGAPALEGISYWMPGVHEVRLKGSEASGVQVRCAARAICRLTLPQAEAATAVTTASSASSAAPVLLEPAPAAAQPPEEPVSATPRELPVTARAPREPPRQRGSRFPLGVLVTSSIAAAGLGATAVWSGMEALKARDLHDTNPAAYDADAVRTDARRTDYLLIGAGACAALAAVTAIWWVKWDERRSTSFSLEGTGGIRASHRF